MNSRTANFDPIARPYRWLEYLAFGRALQRCRLHFLPQLATRRRALVIGDGDGRFLAHLLAANPHLHADAVDSSSAMLRLLTRRTTAAHPTAAARLRIQHANALTFNPTHTYDLISTHFFLDCLTQAELDTLSHRIAERAEPGALWVISEFRIPHGLLHWPARIFIRTLYLAFRLITNLRIDKLPSHTTALTTAGFTLKSRHHSLAGILTSELWEYTDSGAPGSTVSPSTLGVALSQPLSR